MKPAEQLSYFVRDALLAGHARPDIATALAQAGWSEREIAATLDGWSEGAFLPPVPRPRPFVSAREALIYGVMFIALAMITWHIVSLSFDLIERWIPEPGRSTHWYSVQSMRWSIATLIVFVPLFLVLNHRTTRALRADPGQRRSLVRRWFGHVTLFFASMALLGDLIVVIYSALSGELTLRFIARAGVVAIVAGLVFTYFRQELDDRPR